MAFNCADHEQIIQAELDSIFSDSIASNVYKARTGTLDALVPKQSARIPELGKNKTLKTYWEEYCETTVDACSDACVLPTNLIDGGNCVDHTIDECSSKSFTVSEDAYENNAFDIAKTIAKRKASVRKLLLDDVNRKYLAKIDLLAGQNQYVSTDTNFVVTATDTTVPSSYWGVGTLAPYIANVEDYNFGGVLVSGSKLYNESYLSQFALSNENRERANILGSLGLEFDNRNVDQVIGGQGAYLIDPNAIAFGYYNENTATSLQGAVSEGRGDGITIPYGWREMWTTEGGFSVGVDVYYQKQCINKNKISHTFQYDIRWDLINRPASVCEGTTGVLKFVCA